MLIKNIYSWLGTPNTIGSGINIRVASWLKGLETAKFIIIRKEVNSFQGLYGCLCPLTNP
jgi:hypothetical protein